MKTTLKTREQREGVLMQRHRISNIRLLVFLVFLPTAFLFLPKRFAAQRGSIKGLAIVDMANSAAWSGSTPDAWMSAAITAVGSSGGELYIAAGTYAPVAAVSISRPVWVHGAGINNTIIEPTSALSSNLFPITTAVEGLHFSDLTIEMTNAPSAGVFRFSGGLRPILENVRIIYPSTTGTGTAIYKTSTGEIHARNVMMVGAGICVDIQGDGGQEDYWDHIVCEDPGSCGYRLQRTTTVDVGGQYLTNFKITNPDRRTGAIAFLVTSTQANTAQPWFCNDCVGDATQGGHTAQFVNVVNIFLDSNTWLTNGAASSTPMSASHAALLASAVGTPGAITTGGGEIWTRSDLGTAQTLRIINKTIGGTAPSKNIRVNSDGALEVLNDAGSVAISDLGDNGLQQNPGFASTGTTFTSSGCRASSRVGGATAGSFESGISGTCTITITMGNSLSAPHGWSCWANDLTTPANAIHQTGGTATTCILSGTTTSGDTVNFGSIAY
jgi:hypothetical protein